MVFLQRVRDFHDDLVYRHLPDARKYASLVLTGAFALALTTMLATTLVGSTANGPKSAHGPESAYPPLGAELRLSRLADRPKPGLDAARNLVSEADASDPRSPMLVDIDPESGAVHASAGTIQVRGTPINVGNWPLD